MALLVPAHSIVERRTAQNNRGARKRLSAGKSVARIQGEECRIVWEQGAIFFVDIKQ